MFEANEELNAILWEAEESLDDIMNDIIKVNAAVPFLSKVQNFFYRNNSQPENEWLDLVCNPWDLDKKLELPPTSLIQKSVNKVKDRLMTKTQLISSAI